MSSEVKDTGAQLHVEEMIRLRLDGEKLERRKAVAGEVLHGTVRVTPLGSWIWRVSQARV